MTGLFITLGVLAIVVFYIISVYNNVEKMLLLI
jgi:hypothetical protein